VEPGCKNRGRRALARSVSDLSLKKEVRDKVLSSLIWKLRSTLQREEGQGMVEYALILVLVSIVVILILTLLGGTIQNVFSDIVKGL
jgi:pilus assembly protein Flp/PilA